MDLSVYIYASAIVFTVGLFGVFLNRRNMIIVLMSIELILLASNINFVAFSAIFDDVLGQVMVFIVLTVAAAEAAIGIAILLVYYRNNGTIAVDDKNIMSG